MGGARSDIALTLLPPLEATDGASSPQFPSPPHGPRGAHRALVAQRLSPPHTLVRSHSLTWSASATLCTVGTTLRGTRFA